MSRFLTDIMNKKTQEKPKLEIVQKTEEIVEYPEVKIDKSSTPTTTRATTPTSTRPSKTSGSNTSIKDEYPVAPINNFQKVTNTITRDAIPQRLFRTGKTKEIYDVLYSLTRGAINPQRFIVISKPQLRKLTGVGSRITLDTCLGYLEIVGLITVTKNVSGQHEGNHYEIFTPEEIGSTTPTSTGTSTPGSHAQRLGVVPGVDTRRGSTGSEAINTGVSEVFKTSLKTNTNDDDENLAFSGFIKKFATVSKKLTGKEISKREVEKWEALAELLILELEVAASRSGGVSSVPAFLTEVLRRQFFTARQQKPPVRSSAIKPDKVGKSELESFEIKSLDERGREAALEQLQEFAGESFLEDFKKWYTAEDWQWLVEKLKDAPTENL